MGDVLTEALEGFAGDANVCVVVVTGGAPGYFNRHFNIPALIVAYAGIGCLHQAARPQRLRDAAGAGIGARTKPFFEIVYL